MQKPASRPLAPTFLAALLTLAAPLAGTPLLATGDASEAATRTETPEQTLAQLERLQPPRPADVEALTERAGLRETAGQHMAAFLDRREIARLRPGDATAARLAAYSLAAAGAPQAALAWLEQNPAGRAGAEGEALVRHLEGDLAARRVRWGWAEPVFDPADEHHEANSAIAALSALRAADPTNTRATSDLLLAYRLAERMPEALALWENELRRADAPYWLRLAAADAYLAEGRPAEAESLYRSVAGERPDTAEPWAGIYWATIEQRRYDDAVPALDAWAQVPGQALVAEIQRGWLLLFQDRVPAGQAHFEALFEGHPGDPRVRQGLATAHLWQGFPRQGLREVDELLARTTHRAPRVDNPSTRISRAGALSSLGDLDAARDEAEDLADRYPDNVHAQRLRRDLRTQLAPEIHLDARYDTSDRGLGESWGQLEATVPLGTRVRVGAGLWQSHSEDEQHSLGDVEQAFATLSWRPDQWLAVSAAIDWDLSPLDRDPGASARVALLPDDRWRVDLGYARDGWRDLPLRARAAGMVGDTIDLGVAYTAGTSWNARFGGGRSTLSDDNERTWLLAAGQLLARQGPMYRAHFGAELYASENSRSDVVYFSPASDRSASLTHRSEWVTANRAGRRHTFSLFAHAGVYDQDGFDPGPVGGLWLQSDLDLSGRLALVLGAGARSQLYDGTRELDPRVFVTLRQKL
jgi:biofilm PGA synthesis protein PgaA